MYLSLVFMTSSLESHTHLRTQCSMYHLGLFIHFVQCLFCNISQSVVRIWHARQSGFIDNYHFLKLIGSYKYSSRVYLILVMMMMIKKKLITHNTHAYNFWPIVGTVTKFVRYCQDIVQMSCRKFRVNTPKHGWDTALDWHACCQTCWHVTWELGNVKENIWYLSPAWSEDDLTLIWWTSNELWEGVRKK